MSKERKRDPAQHALTGKALGTSSKKVAIWTTRTTSSGRFAEAKRSGKVLRGARVED